MHVGVGEDNTTSYISTALYSLGYSSKPLTAGSVSQRFFVVDIFVSDDSIGLQRESLIDPAHDYNLE